MFIPPDVSSDEQEIINQTCFMMHKFYCENDIEAVIDKMDNHIVWFGAAENEYAMEAETVIGIFRQFAGQVPKCNISEEQYHVLQIAPDAYLCSGRMWIATDPSTQISLRVHQRITMIFRRSNGIFRCCHIHISNPYTEMTEEDVGFPHKMAQQSYQYLQEQIDQQKKQIESQSAALQQMIYEDFLTGVYNRNKFMKVESTILYKDKNKMGIACVDLNGLKKRNDKFGHSAGDAMICSAADQLRQVFDGKVYRIGGDEFVVIDDTKEEAEFHAAVCAVQKGMEENGISCSIGISWRSENCSIREQVEEADRLMYQQKRKFYSSRENDRRNR